MLGPPLVLWRWPVHLNHAAIIAVQEIVVAVFS